jgi:hypothetical protein
VGLFESKLPRAAPKHVVRSQADEGELLTMETEVLYWAMRDACFTYGETVVRGIHVRFDKEGDRPNAFVEFSENPEEGYSLGPQCGPTPRHEDEIKLLRSGSS